MIAYPPPRISKFPKILSQRSAHHHFPNSTADVGLVSPPTERIEKEKREEEKRKKKEIGGEGGGGEEEAEGELEVE